ncbi:SGNH/GDSL hydrolase family protein [Curtobacterium ammoniigenes]|uniref:SGNH/GDSL hydrolase family protein n=1 Tax=Curtobacterium ammoniigenes TaxID=395387 RepID=UPI000837453E|nr:SGNH/GDSL hydrolase family protein [Curtobacterium ammoniigenes]
MDATPRSFAAIGDSFAEGIGDELPDGSVRGWADLVALGLARAADPETVTYANLAVRGRLLRPILDDQLEAAIALRPALLSVSGGNNDIIRPRVAIPDLTSRLFAAMDRAAASGAHVMFVTVANMTKHLPLGRVIEARGNRFADAIRAFGERPDVTVVDNWGDPELFDQRYWAVDSLHLNTAGHLRVAQNVLRALHVDVSLPALKAAEIVRPSVPEYWRDYVLPWVGRRLTRRSSGDGRAAKRAKLEPVLLSEQ